MGARQDDLGPARRLVDIDDVGHDAIASSIGLALHLLAYRQDGLGPPQVDHQIASLEAPHDPRDQLSLAVLVLIEDVLALGLADPLQDHLLGGLSGDAPETLPGAIELQQGPVLGVLLLGARLILLVEEDLKQQLVVQLGLETEAYGLRDRDLLALVRGRDLVDDHDDLEQVDPACLLVELGLHLAVHAKGTLGGRQDRLFEGLHQDPAIDVLVFRDLIEHQAEGGTITAHDALRFSSLSQSGTRFALAMSSTGRW